MPDLNADGKLDLIIGGNPFVQVFLGNGDGTFAIKDSYLAGEILGVQSIVIADFNLDAKPDVGTANTILLGNGDGSFQGNAAISLGNNNSVGSAVAGDFNRDGSADIAVISSNQSAVNILLNDGTPKFSLAHTYCLAMPAVPIAAADLNQDGKLDLLLTCAGMFRNEATTYNFKFRCCFRSTIFCARKSGMSRNKRKM